jgi:hypothetical protein
MARRVESRLSSPFAIFHVSEDVMVADANRPPQPDTPDTPDGRGGFYGYGAERGHMRGEDDENSTRTDEAAPAAAWGDAFARFGEVREYAAYYVKARVDALKLSLRNLILMVALGIIGAFAGGALVVMAVVLLCIGIAHGLGELFGGRLWLGDLVTAILLLGAIGATVYIAVTRVTKTSKERVVKAYEQRKRQQRADHGVDVHERAEEQREYEGQA